MLREVSLGNYPVSLFELLLRLNWGLFEKAVNIIFQKCVFLFSMIEGELGPFDKAVTPVHLCT